MTRSGLSKSIRSPESWALAVGLAYIALLPLNIPLHSPHVFLHDLLAPVMALTVLLLVRPLRLCMTRHRCLIAFLAVATIVTFCHLRGVNDIRELAIFAYMAVIFWFFRMVPLRPRFLLWTGVATLGTFCIYAMGQELLGTCDTYAAYEEASLSFIAKRFFFTFSHPNLVGSFYVLPVLCALLIFFPSHHRLNSAKPILKLSILALLCVPLAMTVSKHMIISIALVMAFMARNSFPFGEGKSTKVLLLFLISIFVIFYATVIIPFFPLNGSFPFVNGSTFGMYTIHQVAYLKMMFSDVASFLLGRGRVGVINAYPGFVDPDATRAILAEYKSEWLVPTFTRYMDAHNEYLNLGATFGVPAMALCYAFLVQCARRALDSKPWRLAVVFFVVSVFMASLWDDLLSKRWIWVSLGILMQRADPLPPPCPQHQGEPDGS